MITKEQATEKWLREIHHNVNKNKDGSCERWRQYGQIKLWKTRPNDFSISIKNGMSNYSHLTQENAEQFHLESDCQNVNR